MWHHAYVVYEPQMVLAAKSTTETSKFTTLAATPSTSLPPTSTTSSPTHTTSAPEASQNSTPRLGKGSTAGIAVGLATIFVVLGAIALIKRRRERRKPPKERSAAQLEGRANNVWKKFLNGEWKRNQW